MAREPDLLEGEIEYPFAETSKRIGTNQNREPFIIRSTMGNAEYEVQLPGAADDYDVSLPISEMSKGDPVAGRGQLARERNVVAGQASSNSLPHTTDREFEKNMPRLPEPEDRSLVESALGVGESNGPKQSPSYVFTLAKINELYLERKYELALVEINQLLSYYSTDPRLYKMKGTILIKMRNFRMAEIAWSRAMEFNPGDTVLTQALASLRTRLGAVDKIPVEPAATTPSLQ